MKLNHKNLVMIAGLAALLPQVIPLVILDAQWSAIALSVASVIGSYFTGLAHPPTKSTPPPAIPRPSGEHETWGDLPKDDATLGGGDDA